MKVDWRVVQSAVCSAEKLADQMVVWMVETWDFELVELLAGWMAPLMVVRKEVQMVVW